MKTKDASCTLVTVKVILLDQDEEGIYIYIQINISAYALLSVQK